jgi:hypothetical protein
VEARLSSPSPTGPPERAQAFGDVTKPLFAPFRRQRDEKAFGEVLRDGNTQSPARRSLKGARLRCGCPNGMGDTIAKKDRLCKFAAISLVIRGWHHIHVQPGSVRSLTVGTREQQKRL